MYTGKRPNNVPDNIDPPRQTKATNERSRTNRRRKTTHDRRGDVNVSPGDAICVIDLECYARMARL